MQKLAHDLRTTIASSYAPLLSRLLTLLQRSLSAPALTALLATFSSLFKYLLVPSSSSEPIVSPPPGETAGFSSSDENLVHITWTQISAALPKCEAETQRAMAEVWGSLLRRVKSGQREGLIRLMVQGLEGVEDACAWAVIFACKVCLRLVVLEFHANRRYSPSRKHCTPHLRPSSGRWLGLISRVRILHYR